MTTIDLPTAKRFFAAAPFMADLGVEPVHVEPGKLTTVLALAERHLQHTGQVHAGVSTAMADHTMGAAAQTLAPEHHLAITADLRASLLRAARGTRLVCEARVVKAGRNLSFTEADVYVETGHERVHVLRASATMAITAAKKP